MYLLTQGTIISGVRSNKYLDTKCYGIVISARCDLANCKISKIYYLIAVSSDDWLLSDEGFNTVLSQRSNELESQLQNKLNMNGLDWASLKNFSVEEFATVVHDSEVGLKKDANKCLASFETFKQYTSGCLKRAEKQEVLSKEMKNISSYLLSIANGQMIHFIYIPESAYLKDGSIDKGLIIDLQELEYISIADAEKLANFEIDVKNKLLTEEEKEHHNNRFFLFDSPGFAIAEWDIKSPWIEYLMQRFSNAFIRIGVDSPQKESIQTMITRVSKQNFGG